VRVLAFDPGAERCGWAVIEGGKGQTPRYRASGIIGLKRPDGEPYQAYRLSLIGALTGDIQHLWHLHEPEEVVNETVPPSTSTAFASNGVQAQLAATTVTTIQVMAQLRGVPVRQVSANTVKAKIGGGKSATKVKVRNGVYSFFPDLKETRGKEWVKVHDESDAIAIGLTSLGYRVSLH
jgi:Holliday junction resolvasome RuvABC endonuclease subunit